MKLTRFLFFAAIALISITISGCNKDTQLVDFEGTWNIDTASFLIVYNEEVSLNNPEAIVFLREHKSLIISKITEPDQIVFSGSNVSFIYTSNESNNIYNGTYTQYEIYATIYNHVFPSGINAACNKQKLELYYGREYMMSILKSILTKSDPAYDIFDSLIDSFDGVGAYYKEK